MNIVICVLLLVAIVAVVVWADAATAVAASQTAFRAGIRLNRLRVS
jgi:hypothetical protein